MVIFVKVWDKWCQGIVGDNRWVEFVGDDGKGHNVHYLFKADIGIYPSGRTIEMKNKGVAVSLAPVEGVGEYFVFWDEKPAEPYFKDEWPEWEVLGEW